MEIQIIINISHKKNVEMIFAVNLKKRVANTGILDDFIEKKEVIHGKSRYFK